MMLKHRFAIIIIIAFLKLTLNAQTPPCPYVYNFNCEASLPNPCSRFKISSWIYGSTVQTFTVSYNFGDGSAVQYYTFGPNPVYSVFPTAFHNYTTPGTYSVTFNITNELGTCIYNSIKTVTSVCSPCTSYSVLSTGFDRADGIPFTNNLGQFDPYWYVIKKQYVSFPPNYLPIPGSEIYYPNNTLAYDITPNLGYGGSLASGDAKYISVNSSYNSQDPDRNIITYRTYFNLPNPLPANKTYSLALSIRGDDAIYKVGLNGINIKPVGYETTGNSYTGDPMIISVKSCDSTFFQTGPNYIDIALGDLGVTATQLSAEILLYECSTSCTCPTAIGATYQTNICYSLINNPCQEKCKNISGILQINSNNSPNYSVAMNFGDGTVAQNYAGTTTGVAFTHNYATGTYTVTANIIGPDKCSSTYTFVANIICEPPPCSDCIGSFAPIPDSTYIISAWVKEANATVNTTNYTNAKIEINFYTAVTTQLGSTQIGTPVIASPSGLIIDGWQKIEQKFKIPAGAAAIKINLKSNGQNANFDDIRVFPYNGSIKSYVYDPKTMRLMAELDERNYATFYEYDEEGKLIRVKKETEKGIMTIKESRNSSPVK